MPALSAIRTYFLSVPFKTAVALFLLFGFTLALHWMQLSLIGIRQIWILFYIVILMTSLYKGFAIGFGCCLLYCLSVYLQDNWFSKAPQAGRLQELFYHLGTGTLFAGIAAFVHRQMNRQVIANRAATETMAQLTSLSDNLPGSFIYQGWQNKEGYAEILYISNGISAYSNASEEEIKQESRIITNLIQEEDRLRYYAAVAETGIRFVPN